jgi:two-component system cell cycle response regulator DivK
MPAATLVAPRRPFPRVRARHVVPAAPRRQEEPSVLVADTHEDSRTVCAMLLRHSGVHVLEADTGEEVIRLAHAARPRAIVMSTTLRGVDGLRALEVLKDHPATARIPVVVTSSVCGDEHERRARAAGCAAYLLKPCPPRRVMEEVEAVAGALLR